MALIDNKYQKPAPTEHDGFDGSRFDQGEIVEALLRHPRTGGVFGRATGTCIERHVDVDVSRDGEDSRTKTLVLLRGVEGYKKRTEDGVKPVDEAWFAEEALRKPERDVLDGVSFN